MSRILIAEDDPKQADLIRLYAENDGHDVTVVTDGTHALTEVRRTVPDVLVLDVMLPGITGHDVCRILRAETTQALISLPILMLTARTTEDDLLLGLDLGADDYVTKPYSPRELMGRVRALARRSRAPGGQATGDPGEEGPGGGPSLAGPSRGGARVPDGRLVVGSLTVDTVRHEVHSCGVEVPVTPGEFALLELFAAEPNRAFTREQLMTDPYGTDRYPSRRTVDMHVMNLRRKLAAVVPGPDAVTEPVTGLVTQLVTVYGVGYKLVARPSDG